MRMRRDIKSRKRLEIWLQALKRLNPDKSKWVPSKYSRVCSLHFHGGKPSTDETNPDYKPSIFPTGHGPTLSQSAKSRLQRRVAKEKEAAKAKEDKERQEKAKKKQIKDETKDILEIN